jgi:DeoR/GlpR family transcriptional regulator of sugar metabolism
MNLKNPNERRAQILELVAAHKQVYVQELAGRFHVTQETIRRDLNRLEEQRQVKKIHGGAVGGQLKFEMEFGERAKVAGAEKKMIAHSAARLFKPGDTLFVDFGTTTLEFASAVKAVGGLTVITHSPLIGHIVKSNPDNEVILIGGQLARSNFECLGGITLNHIARFFADYAVIGAVAVHPDRGIMDVDVEEAAVARKMVAQSNRTVVLADGGKLGGYGTLLVSELKPADILVTTSPRNPAMKAALMDKIKIILADQDPASPAFERRPPSGPGAA